MKIDEIIELGAKKVGCQNISQCSWNAWPCHFGSTVGPHGGRGGSAITEFQVYGFENKITGERIKYCDGVWKSWIGHCGGW